MGMYDTFGSITVGKRGDIVLLDEENLEVRGCIIGGKMMKTGPLAL